MDDDDLKRPVVTQGRSDVLVLSTSWGSLPFVTDTGSYLDLAVTLPLDLEPGSSFGADNRKGYLRIGGMDVGYESHTLEGTVTVVASSADWADLDLDVWARAPVVDLNGRGDQHITGRVRAVHVARR